MMRYAPIALTVVFSMLSAPSAHAQANAARIDGTVSDPQSLALPGVKLTLTETRTGLERTITSSASGTYFFAGLPPGNYRLAAELTGFQTQTAILVLEVDQQLRLDLRLDLVRVSQQVEVQSTVPLVHREDAALGEVVNYSMTSELPLNGRQFLELALLVPGVHMSHGAQAGDMSPLYWRPGQDSAISVGGSRPGSNYYLLDGTTNTDPAFNTYVVSLAPDAIREFKVQTLNYSAQYGGGGGGIINVVSMTGTNQFHGTVYEFLRNSMFDAREFTTMDELPHFSQNQFGGSLGGPLRRNQTFFFANYEGFRKSQGQSMILSVPKMSERLGDFSDSGPIYDPATAQPNPDFDPDLPVSPSNPRIIRRQFSGNIIPPERINPVAAAVLARFVVEPNLDMEANNYFDARAAHQTNDQFTARLDHQFSPNDTIFGRYTISLERGFTPENLPGFGSFHDHTVQNLTLNYTHIFSPAVVSTTSFGLQRMALTRLGEKANGENLIAQLGIPGVGFGGPQAYGLPAFDIQGYDRIGDSILATPVYYYDTMFHWGEVLNWQRGPHALKIGGGLRRFRWPMLGFFQNRGYFQFTRGFTTETGTNDGTGNALASFLLGLPVVAQRQAGLPSMDMRQTSMDGFIQDDWRVRSNLTLNLGLRYEYSTPLHDVRKILTNLDFVDGRPMAYVAGQSGYPQGVAWMPKTNFAPRLGFAFSPFGDRTVVRAAYGIFYTPVIMNTWCNLVHNVPLVFPETLQSDNFIPAIQRIGFTDPVLGQTTVSFASLDPRADSGYVQQWNFNVQRQMSASTVLEVGYIGARGVHLQRSRLVNNALPGPGPIGPRRPFRQISFVPGTMLPEGPSILSTTFPVSGINWLENSASSSYNAGFASLKRKLASGLNIVASYTFSKNLSDAPDFRSPMFESAIPQDNRNLVNEWGLSCDVQQRLVGSVLLQLPFKRTAYQSRAASAMAHVIAHWNMATIFQMQSGFPYTVSVFGDTANAGTLLGENPVRANVVPGVNPNLPEGQRDASRWFNTDAFVAPPAFQFGNAGRNTLRGPSMQVIDLALYRNFVLKEGLQLQFRSELFNALNHTNLGIPNRFVNTPQFGSITMAMTPARQIQFALKLLF